MINQGIHVKCKRCGKPSPAQEFILDPVYRMMVCRNCVKERQMKDNPAFKQQEAAKKAEEKSRPAGYDNEDAMLEKAARMRQAQAANVQKLSGDSAKYTCQKCTYRFVIHLDRGYPRLCPQCGTPVSGVKF
jgi:rubrerythrin